MKDGRVIAKRLIDNRILRALKVTPLIRKSKELHLAETKEREEGEGDSGGD